jgi:hypothetical protein
MEHGNYREPGLKATQATKVSRETQEQQEFKEILEPKVFRATLGQQGLKEVRV